MIKKGKVLYFSLELSIHNSLDSIISDLPDKLLEIAIEESYIDDILIVLVFDGGNVSISISCAGEIVVLERFVVVRAQVLGPVLCIDIRNH